MKIVHIILTHSFAGSERYAVELANTQAEQQHQVTVILHKRGCEQRANTIRHRLSDKVQVKVVDGWKFFAIWQARKIIRALKPDVAHAHLSAGCRVLQGLKGLCLRVATLHICYKKQQHAKLDALIAIAPWQLDAIPEPLKEHSIQLDNWTNTNLKAPGSKAELRQKLGLSENELIFGTLGRVERTKGHDVLVQAFLKANIPNARLVIVGDGKAMPELKKLVDDEHANNKVLLPGFSTTPQQWLYSFDVFVSSARYEPFGLVFLEAMQAGLPVLATQSQGAQYLQPLFGRDLVPVDDADALANAMLKLCGELPQHISYPMQRFDIQARVQDVVDFYQQELLKLN
ncbi:glycosyltransferase [Rheinheimera sp. 4Y26]|uniref:glycosyltransferase n=1 Tax=Rheinheimera sp. 4Y26 TaxID=2977811 RepID=UPI0021B0DEED|nr:glycosyltransferase [Rheinheimera sp. 4Y26]MCT6698714.1 glycosyltransferase [Rheinheimera sp. 4Y26]